MLWITFPSDWPDPMTSETLSQGSRPCCGTGSPRQTGPPCVGLASMSWPVGKHTNLYLHNTLHAPTQSQLQQSMVVNTNLHVRNNTQNAVFTCTWVCACGCTLLCGYMCVHTQSIPLWVNVRNAVFQDSGPLVLLWWHVTLGEWRESSRCDLLIKADVTL